MERYIFEVSENVLPIKNESIYVRATESEMRKRMYAGGFMRFLCGFYDYSKNYKRDNNYIEGKKIMSIAKFDKWREEHNCC